MSTFVSKKDQLKVAEATKVALKLKVTDDATKSVMKNAIQACLKSAPFDRTGGDNMPFGSDAMDFTFFDADGNIENASTNESPTVEQPADQVADQAADSVDGDLNDGDGQANSIATTHNNVGMKTCTSTDGTRMTFGGKGPLNIAPLDIEDLEECEEDPVDEVCEHYMYGGKGLPESTYFNIEDVEVSEEDPDLSEEDANALENADTSEDDPDFFEEDAAVSDDDVESEVVNSSPTRTDVGMKSCVRSDGTRYAIGAKGPANLTPSKADDAEPTEDDTEDQVINNHPDRSTVGMKSCARPDGTRFTVGIKGPIDTTPSPTMDIEVSEEDFDETHDDLGSEDERQDLVKTVREEVEQILEAIADVKEQIAVQVNILLKKRLQGKLMDLEHEMRLKLAPVDGATIKPASGDDSMAS